MSDWSPTTDRDIRFNASAIWITTVALREEVKRRTRSIEKAEASKRAGNTVQYGTLDEHYKARAAAREVLDALEVARQNLARRTAEHVKATSERT